MKKILLFLLLTTPALATETQLPPSLFFTPDEARQAERMAAHEAPAGTGDIHLGAVMYYGPEDWTIWLQGMKWSPDTSHDNLHVLSVSPNEVQLSWHNDENGEDKEITLHPNQSYQIATGQIILAP